MFSTDYTVMLWNAAFPKLEDEMPLLVYYGFGNPDLVTYTQLDYMNQITLNPPELPQRDSGLKLYIQETVKLGMDPKSLMGYSYEIYNDMEKPGWVRVVTFLDDVPFSEAAGYTDSGIVILKLKRSPGGNIVIGVIDIDP